MIVFGFKFTLGSVAGQKERAVASRVDAHSIGSHGVIGAMRRASSDQRVMRLGLVALRLGEDVETVTEGLAAYLDKEEGNEGLER